MKSYLMALPFIFASGFGIGYVLPVDLEDRVSTLERDMAACCGSQYGPGYDEEERFKEYVQLKARIAELEREVEEVKAVVGMRK